MMFLQFFIWGACFVTMGTYLLQGLRLHRARRSAAAYSTMPWGAIVAPFVVGMVADRFFAAEKVLGVMHLVGAGAALLGLDDHDARGLLLGAAASTRSATTRRSRS